MRRVALFFAKGGRGAQTTRLRLGNSLQTPLGEKQGRPRRWNARRLWPFGVGRGRTESAPRILGAACSVGGVFILRRFHAR